MKTHYPKLAGLIILVLLVAAFSRFAMASNGMHPFNEFTRSIARVDSPQTANAPKPMVKSKKKNKNDLEDGEDDNIRGRAKQEFLRLRDPAVNAVPLERLIDAKQTRDQLMVRQKTAIGSPNSAGGGVSSIFNNVKWTERGPNNVGGRTRALIFDLNDAAGGYKKVFAGGVDGGLWYTNDITATPVQWNKIDDFFDNIAISCIAQNPVNPKEIYAGTGEGWYNEDGVQGLGVWKSSDGGATWARLQSTSAFQFINAILVDKNGSVYVGGRGFGVEKSSDGGSTWNQVIARPATGADLQLAANGDVYASTGSFSVGNIFVSDFSINGAATGDAGTWRNITPNAKGVVVQNTNIWWRIKLACAPGDANIAYAFMEGSNSYNVTSIQQYNKSTNTWSVKTVPTGSSFINQQAWYSIAAAVDPNDANTLFAGSLDAVKSTDGGSTWTPVSEWSLGELQGLSYLQYVHADHHAYVYAPGNSGRFLMGTDGGVFYTSNANAPQGTLPSFYSKDNGYNVTQFYSVALHPTDYNFAMGGTQDNGTQQFTHAGVNRTNQVIGGDGAYSFIDQLNPNIQIGSYTYSNYYISTDNGTSFNLAVEDGSGQFINPADYDSKNKVLYASNYFGHYIRWVNVPVATKPTIPNVSNVTTVNVPGFHFGSVTAVTVSPITPNRLYFGLDNGTVAVVDDANTGASKSSVILSPNNNLSTSVSCIAVDPKSEDHLLVSYFNYGIRHVFETKNATSATPMWTSVDQSLPDMPVRWAMFFPGDATKAIIATELGVWTTDKLKGTSTEWTPTNSGLANVRVDMLKFRAADRTIAAATHGRGIFTATLPSSDASLANLTLSDGTLSPAFASGTIGYAASEPNATKSITVTPTTSDGTATITVNGKAVTSGKASGLIALKGGPNMITVVVSASDGATTKTYTVKVTRVLSADADLAGLRTSNGGLSPSFTSQTTTYSKAVGNATTSITVTPVVADTTAMVKVDGKPVTSGSASTNLPLNVGDNTITVTVIAQDGSTTKTYTIAVTRGPSADDNLSSLTTSKGPLTPAFSASKTTYTRRVASTVASITLTAVTSDAGATLKVNGKPATSGSASGDVALKVGQNVVQVVVSAQDHTATKTYVIIVTRLSGGSATAAEVGQLAADDLKVHQGVSPNGDGKEDFLAIDGIAKYPDNTLKIMTRDGALVFESKGYDNSTKVFDGHSNKNGKLQRPGTYFYSLDYTVKGVTKHKTGFIVLKF